MAYINVAGVLQKQSEKYCHWSRINYWSQHNIVCGIILPTLKLKKLYIQPAGMYKSIPYKTYTPDSFLQKFMENNVWHRSKDTNQDKFILVITLLVISFMVSSYSNSLNSSFFTYNVVKNRIYPKAGEKSLLAHCIPYYSMGSLSSLLDWEAYTNDYFYTLFQHKTIDSFSRIQNIKIKKLA